MRGRLGGRKGTRVVAVLISAMATVACADEAGRDEPGSEAGGAVRAAATPEVRSAATLEVRVDPRVELLAILFRVAGRDEYNLTQVAAWESAVDRWFEPWAEHPAVVMTERLAGPYNVGFFVPMNLAVHLTPPPALEVRTPLMESPTIHRTWVTYPDTTALYLELVRGFARSTRFDDFMNANRALLDSTEVRLRRLVAETVDLDWFDRFWGVAPGARFVLVPGLTNGRASYGVEYQGERTRELYAVAGVMEADDSGLPVFGPGFTATVVHELNHPYVDPLVESRLEALAPAADSLFEQHAERLREQAIGSGETLLYESLVRAAVARYRGAMEGPAALDAEVAEQVEAGFAWMPGLVELLGRYEGDRARFPTMAAFMPHVVAFFQDAAMG